MKIIVNADDFGISPKVNESIYNSAKEGYISSSTILAVSKYLEEAIEMIDDLPHISFGAHLAFTDNFESIHKKPVLFNDNDIINLKGLNFFKVNILIDEFSKQIEKLLNKGVEISHIDTHHHMHLYPLVLFAVMKVAKKYNISKIRTENIFKNKSGFFNGIYRSAHSFSLKSKGFIQPDFYTDFYTFVKYQPNLDKKTIEIMCHPGGSYNDEKYFNERIYSKVKPNLISYYDLS